jgi:hypothetical protein
MKFERWLELKGELNRITLEEEGPDMVSWSSERKGHFSTKSLYRFISDGGVRSRIADHLWKCKIPLEIKKFFLWQVFNNKLQCAHSLSKRGWKGCEKCCPCGMIESVNHIFFDCIIA